MPLIIIVIIVFARISEPSVQKSRDIHQDQRIQSSYQNICHTPGPLWCTFHPEVELSSGTHDMTKGLKLASTDGPLRLESWLWP